ncbi:MAG: 3-dehydroquinate synthase [Fibrobacter sp.]|nr:3-dehydroquinate synthase [Fibrobacter sp.]
MKFKSDKNIWLTGFMATGKSRVGAEIAQKLKRPLIDTDKLIEQRVGMSVADFFDAKGEVEFRKTELAVIRELCQNTNQVISLGGGSLTIPGVAQQIHANGILVALYATPETLSERIGRKDTRPLMANLSPEERLKKIETMLLERAPYYAEADFRMESSEDIKVHRVAAHVLATLQVWAHKAMEVRTSSGERYPIFIGYDWLDDFDILLHSLELAQTHSFLLVSDKNVANKQKKLLKHLKARAKHCPVFTFIPGENQKNLKSLNKLYTYMLKRGFTRKSCLLQFSGGVVGDMAGFGAATYQRGIPFIQIPTTLLSMVDSSVGGKIAVNHPAGKNMIGAFYQPRAVLIDLKVLETLDDAEYIAGLAEIVKYGIIYDKEFFDYLESHAEALMQRSTEHLQHIVRRSCEIKADVVSQDEKEQGLRAILNYGHTFGHAIEKMTNYERFSHGMAVGIGMRVAGRVATLLGKWSAAEEERQNVLLDRFSIPRSFVVDPQVAWNAMGVDKKNDSENRVYILPTSIGKVEKVLNVPQDIINQAWESINGE